MNKNKSFIFRFVLFSLLLVILIVSSPISSQNNNTLPLVTVISENENGEVYRKSYGVITRIAEETLILTDYYVVAEVNNVKVKIDKKLVIYADVIKDAKTQIAILIPKVKKELNNKKYYTLGDSSSVLPGERVYIPNDDSTKSEGIMENIVQSFSKYYSEMMITTLRNHVSDSGKPVLNYRNEVIGLLTFYGKNRIIIPANIIKKIYFNKYKKINTNTRVPKKESVNIISDIPININLEQMEKENPIKTLNIYSINNNYFFGEISKIQFGLENTIYVLDNFYKRIYKFDYNYNFLKSEGEDENSLLKSPKSFSIAKNGLVYVLEAGNNPSIKILNRELEFIKEVPLNKNLPYFDIESGEERVYVLSKNRILIYDEKLNYLLTIGGNGTTNDKFKNASDISVIKEDRLVVLDQEMHKIKTFDKNGNYILDFPIHAPIDNSLSTFRNDYIVVVDKSNSKIKLFESNGDFFRLYQADSNSSYGVPKGVIFDNNEQMHIYYEEQAHIKVYNAEGNVVKICASFINDNEKYPLFNPKNIAVTKDKLIMLSRSNYLHIFDLTKEYSDSELEEAIDEEIIDEELNNKESEEISDGSDLITDDEDTTLSEEDEDEDTTLSEEDEDEDTTLSEETEELSIKVEENEYDENKELSSNINPHTAIVLPINYKYNISSIVGDPSSNIIYISETMKGKLYSYNIGTEELSEILLNGRFLALDFIPILAHFDSEYLYTIDKLNHRIIISDTTGLIKNIINIENGKVPIIAVTTFETDNGKEIFVLAKKVDNFYIYNFTENWKLRTNTPLKIEFDFMFGYPTGIAVFENFIFVVAPYQDRILSYNTNVNKETSEMLIPEQIGISYLHIPKDIVLYNNSIFILDSYNNRTIEYKIRKEVEEEINEDEEEGN